MKQNTNFSDAWRKGYQEYRDFARQELQNGYERNPTISAGSEIAGALSSPIRPLQGISGAVTNGIISGIGMTDNNNPTEYAINIGLNTTGSVIGEKVGDMLGQRLQNLQFGISNLGKPARTVVKASSNSLINQINNWRQNEK